MCWLDRLTGFVHREQPVGFRRSFVQLLREGPGVYPQHPGGGGCAAPQLRGAGGRAFLHGGQPSVCGGASGRGAGAHRLYVAGHLDGEPGRIRRKSEDFRMFVIEEPNFDPRCGRAPVDRVIMNEEENT